MKNVSIYTKQTGAGHYNVEVMQDLEVLGNFDTTDMELIDDIKEMKSDGFESELCMHDSFDEVVETVLAIVNN